MAQPFNKLVTSVLLVNGLLNDLSFFQESYCKDALQSVFLSQVCFLTC